MPFDIHDNDDLPFVLVTMSGVLEDAELPVFQDTVYVTPGFQSKNVLMDLTGVTSFGVTVSGLKGFASRALKSVEVRKARSGKKVAYVVSDDFTFGMIRLFTAHVDDMPAEHRVFRSEPEAKNWMNGRGMPQGPK